MKSEVEFLENLRYKLSEESIGLACLTIDERLKDLYAQQWRPTSRLVWSFAASSEGVCVYELRYDQLLLRQAYWDSEADARAEASRLHGGTLRVCDASVQFRYH